MILRILTVATLLLTAAPAAAHEVAKGPHGGRVVEAGDYHVELVVTQTRSVNVFLTDANDKPVSVSGFKGVAIITVGGKAQRIELEPKDDRLDGTSPVALPAAPKGVVLVRTPDGKTSQGRFH